MKSTHTYRFRKRIILAALLFLGGTAFAQSNVTIKGNVYGGGWQGQVKNPNASTSVYGNTTVTINNGTVEGSVYGGGAGIETDEKAGLVEGNTTVNMKNGTVERSIYGGGEFGSVGTFTCDSTVTYPANDPNGHANMTVQYPTSCAQGTGLATVTLNNGFVGKDGSKMPVAGASSDDNDRGWIFCGAQGEADTISYYKAVAMGVVKETHLTIRGGVVTASVYGGCENGLVLTNTLVDISGGQIGTGYDKDNDRFDAAYTETQWQKAIDSVKLEDADGINAIAAQFHECHSWPYTSPYVVYDYYYNCHMDPEDPESPLWLPAGSAAEGSDGHSFFGNVFGGGSGYYPIAPGVWRRTAGRVNGNATINITGGHILTSIYGGNETTDVMGKATINMSGGTLGVPRTLAQIAAHPVTCYVFGAGMGDPRIMFNQWTNVQEAEVNITGGTIFGSVFGGGEEGHVLGDVEVTIEEANPDKPTLIGTWGYSYVDGNIFGGGRGFSGEALTAGSVGGNIVVNINKGKMLGSIYGGGRLASVGTYFVQPENPNYGQLQPGTGHGYITVNITGGTIGNNHDAALMAADYNTHTTGGNVFGGSMGRIELLDGTENRIWPRLACAKNTQVNITGTGTLTIKGNVYGGTEKGYVHEDAGVTLNNENVSINKVFGGGYGSDDIANHTNDSSAYPAKLAGRVMGETNVQILKGTVRRSVFGGGELASVGWQKSDGTLMNGTARVLVSGGTIGDNTMYPNYDPDDPTTIADHDGHVFGGGQGKLNDTGNAYKDFCNVNSTSVTVQGGRIYGAVFGGGADSHVLDGTSVAIHAGANVGTIGTTSWDGSVFGGGKGNCTVNATAGRVAGNVSITMDGGLIRGSIFGGGRHGITGIDKDGNFIDKDHGNVTIAVSGTVDNSGATPVYSTIIGIDNGHDLLESDESVGDIFGGGKGDTDGYDNVLAGRVTNTSVTVTGTPRIYGSVFGGGEMAGVGYWDTSGENVGKFKANTGVTQVTIGTDGGTDNPLIGTEYEFTVAHDANPGEWTIYEEVDGVTKLTHTATGNVYGGCQGDVDLTKPNWVHLARSYDATVNIYGGTIMSDVFGGAEQGTVAGDSRVNMKRGTVGRQSLTASNSTTYSFGSVYGGGFGSNNVTTPTQPNDSSNVIAAKLAGRTYGNTYVNIFGGQVYENVYGGGDIASVGWVDASGNLKNGICTVNVGNTTTPSTAIIGPMDGTGMNAYVFGGGQGVGNDYDSPSTPAYDEEYKLYCNVNSTAVTVNLSTGRIHGSIYGGGSDGHVLGNTLVTLEGGTIGPDDITTTQYGGNIFGGGRNILMKNYTAGRVAGNTHVVMNNGTVKGSVFGGGRNALTGIDENVSMKDDVGTTQKFGWTKVEVKGGSVGENDVVRTYSDRTNGDVYGGGKGEMSGVTGHPAGSSLLCALVKNTEVEVSGSARIYGILFGGGEVANVGKYTWTSTTTAPYIQNITLVDGTGMTKVTVSGGTIGANKMKMDYTLKGGTGADKYNLKYNTDVGHVFGGGEGRNYNPNDNTLSPQVDVEGNRLVDMMATVGSTEVIIKDNAYVKGSVYGGAFNGHVRNNTNVKIQGGQIGAGFNQLADAEVEKYDEDLFFNVLTYMANNAHDDVDYPLSTNTTTKKALFECDHWKYDPATNNPFDAIKILTVPGYKPTDGKTWFGNVFGGGSGYYPYYVETTPGSGTYEAQWNRESGKVYGNATVEITGGHILTSVYGGCETTDVGHFTYDATNGGTFVGVGEGHTGGVVSVTMSGGTLGVPRTLDSIAAHPVTCYLFGAGKGDPRTNFNTWTNIKEATVEVSGGKIYGSVFGGGEDGHVFYDATVNISEAAPSTEPTIIGTTGRSSVDGNIFGGGRGFSGEALTAGVVRGNVEMSISGGTMLGSIFGGGRLASVGTNLVPPAHANYGKMIADGTDGNHGHITINITGGTIGNDYEAVYHTDFSQHSKGGNVFAGGKGRLDMLNGSLNTMWSHTGDVKKTDLTINEATGKTTIIKGNVYGGGELGIVEENATVTIKNGTIWRDVYGGGSGSDNATANEDPITHKTNSPMQLAARVKGNTKVTVEGGWIKKSIYGGGELASVGTVTDSIQHIAGATTDAHHVQHPFYISWPYEFTYADNVSNGLPSGKAEIEIKGGRIGITGKDYMGPWNASGNPVKANGTAYDLSNADDKKALEEYIDDYGDNGDIYVGGKGKAGSKYIVAHMGNVKETVITINYTNNTATPQTYKPSRTDNNVIKYMTGFYRSWADWENWLTTNSVTGGNMGCITGAVYGGAEDGHVYEDTDITLTKGLIGHAIYGGGKGKGKFNAQVLTNPSTNTYETKEIYGINSGKVYGNTNITINAAKNKDAYVVRSIFGGGNLGSVGVGNYAGDDYYTPGYGEVIAYGAAQWADTTGRGHSYISITGGTIGMLPSDISKPESVFKDDIPYGSVFGGCRGMATPEVEENQISHLYEMRPDVFLSYVNHSHVKIGKSGTEEAGSTNGPHLYGSVYGGAQDGYIRWNTNVIVNKGEIGVSYDVAHANDSVGSTDLTSKYWTDRGNVFGGGAGLGTYKVESVKYNSSVAGSVTQKTNVKINGGTIRNCVYGGGNLATVGPPTFGSTDCPSTKTRAKIDIVGGDIGLNATITPDYGGRVFGSSRGIASNEYVSGQPKYANFALCSYTIVNVRDSISGLTTVSSPTIYGSVFGGGENGQVGLVGAKQNIHDTQVNINGGTIAHSVYGGGQGAYDPVNYIDTISGRIMGSTTVNLMGGIIGTNTGSDAYKATIFGGCQSANVWGNTEVNVGEESTTTLSGYDGNVTIYGSVYGANNKNGTPYGNVKVNVYQTHHEGNPDTYEDYGNYSALGNYYPHIPDIPALDTLRWLDTLPRALSNFAIYQVFGGSNQADYTPKAGKEATVNVFQCKENTIWDVYGGSNAAHIGPAKDGSSTNANVNIYGGRVYRVFGGGNGEVRPADIQGTAKTAINGGLINQVFGGSNTNGLVDNIDLNINHGSGCDLYINDVFGGGNNALVIGDVVTTVQCCDASYGNFYGGNSLANIYGNVTVNIFGATYERLFAGSKGLLDDPTTPAVDPISADIKKFPAAGYNWTDNPDGHPLAVKAYMIAHSPDPNLNDPSTSYLCGEGGNVTLNLFGGKINKAAYGGSDVLGKIDGKITVNVLNLGSTCDLEMGSLYGAGRNTAYTPLDASITSPEVNVINGTVGGNVFGGGEGISATTTANPEVNIGYDAATMLAIVNSLKTIDPSNTALTSFDPTNALAKVEGSVYGGGDNGQVEGSTSVNIAKANTVVGINGKTGEDGNVFGGGKGDKGNFIAGRVSGNATVDMTHGTIMGNIYGGGRLGMVGVDENGVMQSGNGHGYTTVKVRGGTVGNKDEIETFTYPSMGNIYGGGKGYIECDTVTVTAPVPAAKILRFGLTKNTSVEISDTLNYKTHVYGIVLGGGELANVGSYTITEDPNTHAITGINVTDGLSKVRISGGIIGGDKTRMRHEHSGAWLNYNDDLGYVYGGGEGLSDNPNLYVSVGDTSLLDLMATVQRTEVTITNDTTVGNDVSKPWVKASVFGGSESGHVKGNTKVTISGGQIGAGYYVISGVVRDSLFADSQFINPLTTPVTTSNSLNGTAHWEYHSPYYPFDPELLSQDKVPCDGKSWFGNVFGGGSGWFPYIDETSGVHSYWYANSGKVWGDTEVEITGGHILNNVYGANESTDVGGKATIKMSGGTVGVPRTAEQYAERPLLGFVYGGGAGDPRSIFNTLTNVASTDVKITGGIVYGSVLGGAEDGHVLGHAEVSVGEATGKTTVIGSSGFSGYDGHVFGGGRGNESNFAAGRVAGNATVTMTKGSVLGNLYGGGFVARTGVGVNGDFEAFVNTTSNPQEYDSINHGMVKIELSGGTIGNPANSGRDLLFSAEKAGNVYGGGRGDLEEHQSDAFGRAANAIVNISGNPAIYGSVYGGGQMANIGHWNNYNSRYTKFTSTTLVTIEDNPTIGTDLEFTYDTHTQGTPLPYTQYDTINGVRRINHTRTGNVYGSGQGDVRLKLNGFPEGFEQGHCGGTYVNISATSSTVKPTIMGSVFGGAEQGAVWGDTKVKIEGGTIGKQGIHSDSLKYVSNHWTYHNSDATYSYGSVFGGSYGMDAYIHLGMNPNTALPRTVDSINNLAGHVYGNTYVTITGGQVCENVFGGGDMASVGEALTDISGNDSLVKGKCNVSISGKAIVGPLDGTGLNAYVYGGCKGIGNDPNNLRKKYCNVNETELTVNLTYADPASGWNSETDGRVYGSLFGGGSDGHTWSNAKVNLQGGLIGTDGTTSWDGNIFGGGRNFQHTNYTAGRVGGNVTVNMTGGQLLGSLFGGGRMALTGIDVNGDMISTDPTLHGNVNVTVSNGTVGNNSNILTWLATPGHTSMGDVFGSGKGDAKSPDYGKVKNDSVVIKGTAKVLGSVYGGGEMSNVGWYNPSTNSCVEGTGDARVTISGGQVGIEQIGTPQINIVGGSVFGGGKGVPGNTETFTGSGTHGAVEYGNVDNTLVTISGGYITNSVFGGGEDGHVITHTVINMSDGTVGQKNTLAELEVDADEQPVVDYIYTGSVLGGGRGTTPVTTSPLVYSDMTGRVFGNATVTISGGTVRHAVYGGGGLASVGTSNSNDSDGLPVFEDKTGLCTVNITGGHIGPTKADLTGYSDAQLNTFFKNLGGNAGWVFGAGCGLAGQSNLTFNDSTYVSISGADTQIVGSVFGGGETAHVKTRTEVKVSGGTIGGIPLHSDGTVNVTSGAYSGINFTSDVDELSEDEFGAGSRVFRGNVYGGGKGTDMVNKTTKTYSATAGAVYGNTNVTIEGGTIYNRVFGGGSLASVGVYNSTTVGAPDHTVDSITSLKSGGTSTVLVKGGIIGTDGNNNGDVFGGGRGLVGRHWDQWHPYNDQVVFLAYVGNTEVTIQTGADIKSNVYGGSANGHVMEDAQVIVTGGTIGIEGHGGWHSNVYGGGGGQHQYQKGSSTHHSITSGRVFGNTIVNISGGDIKHNVYGGGAIASVGTYNIYDPAHYVVNNTGNTTVTITGGTIGVDGNENGMVYGSGRGQIAPIDAFMDSLSYVVKSVVNIGKETSPGVYEGTAKVKGSVYGSGENGHVYEKATVNIYSGTVGCDSWETANAGHFANRGNVYGAGCGTDTYIEGGVEKYNPKSGMVWGNTEVNIKGGKISHNVYGGGAMALVGTYTIGGTGDITSVAANTGKTTVNVSGGTIGTSNAPANVDHGNVYGGSRGPSSGDGFKDKALTDTTNVFISGTANVLGSVYGGGEKSWTHTARVATVSGGTVEKDVYGGGKNGIADDKPFTSLKTVNVRGGHIKGNVFGSSYDAKEKATPATPDWTTNTYWSSFVNISGGTIDENVYAAGYGGMVDGSVCANIGLTAIKKAPTNESLSPSATPVNTYFNVGAEPTRGKINIGGDVFGGAFMLGSPTEWDYDHNITGYSTLFIDGDGYDTESSNTNDDNYMNIAGGIYGSGNWSESGEQGSIILLRRYGERTMTGDEMTDASRTLTSIQRAGFILLDSTNVHLVGAPDISRKDLSREFSILKVGSRLYSANGSGIVLGADVKPAFMDSIHALSSLYLKAGTLSYDQLGGPSSNWEMVGIKNSDNTLYRVHASGDPTALARNKENVILFRGVSQLWVRYVENDDLKYGELNGFFRMRSNFTPTGTRSFAYARPKLTTLNNPIVGLSGTQNEGDGGFLSYDNSQNNFVTHGQQVLGYTYNGETGNDGGAVNTNTMQYPYYNVTVTNRTDRGLDMKHYREWVLRTLEGDYWFVDGRGIGNGGWGRDNNHQCDWGHFPDKPKASITGTKGIYNDKSTTPPNSKKAFDPAKDIIFVVGPVEAVLEGENLNLSMLDSDPSKHYPLYLYRYPGGYKMSNGYTDATTSVGAGSPPTTAASDTTGAVGTYGPGPNYGMMIHAKTSDTLRLDNVFVDGLYSYSTTDSIKLFPGNASYRTERKNVNRPMVVVEGTSKLVLKDSELKGGYNCTDASGLLDEDGDSTPETPNYYVNYDYTGSALNGGAMYVGANTRVYVEGLVKIEDNKQKNGSGEPIKSNVYLPTFETHLRINDTLDDAARIGITSPIRKQHANPAALAASTYLENTFSPVAMGVRPGKDSDGHRYDSIDARAAWTHANFSDDLSRFFANGHDPDQYAERTTYYNPKATTPTNSRTVYFGWTWANIVLAAPTGYDDSDETVVIDSKEDLAWLASRVNGLNGQSGITMSGKTVTQTADLDMKQYVWVPIGASSTKPFSGTYDGQGHLIENLEIAYIGKGDRKYGYDNIGMFGYVQGGTIDRTFVVSGINRPEGLVNIGGLVGTLQSSTLKNSEAALPIVCPDLTAASGYAGGLVGLANGGTIHSSMAMPDIECEGKYGYVGGILGGSTGTSSVLNSFANAKFTLGTTLTAAGGLVGSSENTTMKNCYSHLYDNGNLVDGTGHAASTKFGQLAGNNSGNIANCYFEKAIPYGPVSDPLVVIERCRPYNPVKTSDNIGYMYYDNTLFISDQNTEPYALFDTLNAVIEAAAGAGGWGGDKKYARWARPALSGINGDLPVLMLCNYDGSDHIGAGGFRSVGNYGTTKALQYGGPVRDPNQLDEAISRMTAATDELFVYGDITDAPTVAQPANTKIAIYENAAIKAPGTLANSGANVYVGVTFDNSSRKATDAYGNELHRDWHMFSTPLSNAPLGMNYHNSTEDENIDFVWVGVDDTGNKYVYNPYTGAGGTMPKYPFTAESTADGYFPSKNGGYSFTTDETGGYVYPYDFRTWYEPDWQWINFKRNGPSHWHYDEKTYSNNTLPTHPHIDYYAWFGNDSDPAIHTDDAAANQNETTFVTGKGYMMAIEYDTYMQSHGSLNEGNKTFQITNSTGQQTWTWNPLDREYYGYNLVGNPYHAYLDFDLFKGDNGTINSYSVYDADATSGGGSGAKESKTHGGYRMYVVGGSRGGYYATRYLHPHQGCFVKTDADKTVTFKDSHLVDRSEVGTSSPYRDMPAYRLVNLFAYDPNGHGDVVVIEFDRPENGGGQKVKALRNGNHLIYAHHDTTDYGAFFAVEGTRKVPVRFRSFEEQGTVYTLKWDLQNGYFPTLYLVDNMTGTYYDMTRNDTYTFIASKEDYLSRFYITFDYLDVEENEVESFVFFDGSSWVVNGKGYVELFDMTGRCLYTNTLTGDQSHLYFDRFAKGVYTLRLTDGKTVRIQKIVKQ